MVARRTRNPHGEGSRLRQELIEAAGRLLAASPDGVDLSLRAVAREAGVAAPSVYLRFADKSELIEAVVQDHFDQLRVVVENAIAAASEPGDRLRAGCIAYCRFGLERPGPYRVLFERRAQEGRYLGRFGEQDDSGRRAFFTLVDVIAECISAGFAPKGDPFRKAVVLWSAMHGFVTLLRSRPGFPWIPLEEHVEDLVVGLVGVPRRTTATMERNSDFPGNIGLDEDSQILPASSGEKGP